MSFITKLIEFLKIICITYALCLTPFNLYSVTAINKELIVTQEDGSQLSLILNGDENFHYYSTIDSIPVLKIGDYFYYAYLENNQFKSSDILAHEKDTRTNFEIQFIDEQSNIADYIQNTRRNLIETQNLHRIQRIEKRRELKDKNSFIGSKRGLVILVEFSDLSFSSKTAHDDFYKMFNQPGYNLNSSIGSVRDYFLDQSYGNFNLSFDIVGPVSLSKSYKYYGSNSIETGQDNRPYEMVIEACNMIDEKVNFTEYDWDQDGEVDQVFIIYAGYGEHAGAPSNTIWPHESQLYSKKINLDNVYINTYACSCELRGTSGSILNGIGTPCHEFSHCLGLPDFYDTDYSGAFGMSYWDIMNSGSHSGPDGWGEVPYGYSAYERWYAGWLEPTEISDTEENIELRDLGRYPEALVLYNEGNRNEYYLLENHQADRWYQYVGTHKDMHGLLVTHVDYDLKAWETNSVNPSPNHQRMSIVPADNKYGTNKEDLLGDLFPGVANISTLSYLSHRDCGGKLFNENIDGSYNMNLSITSIIEKNEIISLDIINTIDFPIPQVKEATDISYIGYTANWEALPYADSYVIEQTSTYLWNSVFPITKSETIEVSNQTYCSLNWLVENCDAKYRIKGIIRGIPTEWSEAISVGHPNEVNEINDNNKTYPIEYYKLDGTVQNTLTSGFNIIKRGNKNKKIINH